MKLLFNPASPFARKVRIAILEKGLREAIALEVAQPWPEPTAIVPFNPLGKIPVLLLDDGSALYDSPVICEYLESLTPASRLIPSGGAERFRTLRLQALADGMLDAAVNIVLERRRPAEQQSAMMMQRAVAALRRSLAVLTGELTEPERGLDIGQIAAGCVLGYLDFRLADLGLVTDKGMLDWWEHTRRRPSFLATEPPLA